MKLHSFFSYSLPQRGYCIFLIYGRGHPAVLDGVQTGEDGFYAAADGPGTAARQDQMADPVLEGVVIGR
jgi:hypothetical protein